MQAFVKRELIERNEAEGRVGRRRGRGRGRTRHAGEGTSQMNDPEPQYEP
jgi:hypothetical protein